MIYIRTDSNSNIATGHVMRCLSIASAFQKIGQESIFITSDRCSNELIRSYGFEIICLESKWNDLEYELEIMMELIINNNIDKLLIDSYCVTEKYLNTMKEHTKLIYIDDINLFTYPVDLLINYSGTYKKFEYDTQYRNYETKLCLGYEYVPLREEFQGITANIKKNVKQILFTMGGTDENNITAEFIKGILSIKSFEDITFHIVIGSFNNNYNSLYALVSNHLNINLHYSVKEMAELMKLCDIAISAGGTTLFELCACGVPTICFTIADNQKDGTKKLEEENAIIYVGDIRDDKESCIRNMIETIITLMNDIEMRQNLSHKMSHLIDGKGAMRIVDQIMLL